MASRRSPDLPALLAAAGAAASPPERHVWLVRLVDWLRRAGPGSAPAARLRGLLDALDRDPAAHHRVGTLLRTVLRDADATTLLADHGFAPRTAFAGELADRIGAAVLPASPETADLGELFRLVFRDARDAEWIDAIDDDPTLARLAALFGGGGDGGAPDARALLLDAITLVVGLIVAGGFSAAVRQRMDAAAIADRPFQQLMRAADRVADAADATALRQSVAYLRALLDACRNAARSTHAHLDEYGVSVDVVFQVAQLCARTERADALLQCLVAPRPVREWVALTAALVRAGHERRSVRRLFAHHYSLLARKVAERSAETGEHYIARDRAGYWAMLRRALGGGAVVAVTVFVKFALAALGFAAFWGGLWAGVNYAASFVAIHLAHGTLATKQPAMTAPAMAARLEDVTHDESVERFVDEVAHLIRTQVAGIVGNVVAVAPLVLAVQWAWSAAFGAPLVGTAAAGHVLHSLTLLGPTALYAALTGVLLFASSLVGGWAENWFVWHRLDSAIAWNPRIVAALGRRRAQRWARWWRAHVSALAGNASLGLLLGLAPVVADFFGLPLDVRHVTLAAGQVAAAAGALGPAVVGDAAFWWCVAAVPGIGALNLGVAFWLAFRVALRSRGLLGKDRSRIHAAIRRRLWRAPGSFVWPPR